MLQKVTIGYFLTRPDGHPYTVREDVLIDTPDGDSAGQLAIQAHGPRFVRAGALCEIDETGVKRLRYRIFGVDTPSAADIERLAPKPEPVSEATKAGEVAAQVTHSGTANEIIPPNAQTAFQETAIKQGARIGEPIDLKPKSKGGRPKGSRNRAKVDAAA